MMHPSRRAVLAAAAAWSLQTLAPANATTAYPNKPIKLVVGFPAGGGTDVLARLLGSKVAERLGQPVLIENRPGANMMLGIDAAAKAHPDGYTLAISATPTTTSPALYQKVPYDTAKDLTWITQLTRASLVLVVNEAVPASTLPDLIALAKKAPGKLVYASGGTGGSIHLAAALLERMADVKLLHAPYKGNAPAVTDLLAGRVHMMFGDIPQLAPLIRAGKLKAIAVSTTHRSAALPDVPTIAESGLPGYEVPVWYGLVGPARMPADVVMTIVSSFRDVLADPTVKGQLAQWGVEPVGSQPEEFDAFAKMEVSKWARVIKDAEIRLD